MVGTGMSNILVRRTPMLTLAVRTPPPGRASRMRHSIANSRVVLAHHSRMVTTNSPSGPNSSDVLAIMLVVISLLAHHR